MWICKKCGAENYDNYKCRKCGAENYDNNNEYIKYNTDKDKQKPELVIAIIIAAIAVIAIAVIAIILYTPNSALPISEGILYPITLTAVSDEKVYDGTPLNNKSIKSSALADQNHTMTADYEVYDSNGNSIKGGPIDVGVYTKKVGNVHIYSGKTEITDQYDITTVDGTLRILPPTPIPTPAPTPTPKPSAADLDAINADIVYPEDDSMYLPRYRTATVTPSGGNYSVYAFKDPTMSNDPMREGNWYYAMRGTEVTVLAEASEYSCVIINDTQQAGWIHSIFLISDSDIHDLKIADSRVVKPNDSSWLTEYETKYVKSDGGYAIALRLAPKGVYDATTGENYIEDVLEASEVTVLAEQGKFSLIQTNTGSIGWVKSKHLVTEY